MGIIKLSSNSFQIKSFFLAMTFLLPFLIINFVFLICPFIKGIWMSFQHWDLLEPVPNFNGIRNYSRLIEDSYFWTSFLHTLEFIAITVPLITVLGLSLALLLNRRGYFYSLI